MQHPTGVYAGIDVGTSNSCCYVLRDRPGAVPECVTSAFGSHLTPSAVAYTLHDCLVGQAALQQQAANPRSTFVEFKRVLGRPYDAVQADGTAKHWPYTLAQPSAAYNETDDAPRFTALHNNEMLRLTAEQLYGKLLEHLIAELGRAVGPGCVLRRVVVTVPAHFDSRQRRAVQLAADALLAPGACASVCNEPTAAAVAYAERAPTFFRAASTAAAAGSTSDRRLLVFDLGAGTLDVTLLAVNGTPDDHEYTVLASEGIPDVGGATFDAVLLDRAAQHYEATTGRPLRSNGARLVSVRAACEQAKRVLSQHPTADVAFGDSNVTPMTVTRAVFEDLIRPSVRRCTEAIWKALAAARLTPGDIGHAVLVGGGSRVPLVRQTLSEMLPHIALHADISADECVAMGAAYMALGIGPATPAIPSLTSLTSLTPLAPPAPPAPPPRSNGAASAGARSAVSRRQSARICLREVMPATLGIRTGINVMHVAIPKNRPLPTTWKSSSFRPYQASQPFVDICLFQGEHAATERNRMIGHYRLPTTSGEAVTVQLTVQPSGAITVVACNSQNRSVGGVLHLR